MIDKRAAPNVLKKKALNLYQLGHTAAAISREIGVGGATIRRWAKEAGLKRGSLLIKDGDDFKLPMEEDTSLPVVRILKKQEHTQEVAKAEKAAASAAEQFQAVVAGHGMRMLHDVFKAPPLVKNIRDLKTLTEIVSDALGISKRGAGSGKLAIDLKILTTPQHKGEIVEAEIVEKNC